MESNQAQQPEQAQQPLKHGDRVRIGERFIGNVWEILEEGNLIQVMDSEGDVHNFQPSWLTYVCSRAEHRAQENTRLRALGIELGDGGCDFTPNVYERAAIIK